MLSSRAFALFAVLVAAGTIFVASRGGPASGPAAAVRLAAIAPPGPTARVPADPATLANRMAAADTGLRRALHGAAPARDAGLWALYLERAQRMLARHPVLIHATAVRMTPRLARETRSITMALRELRRLSAHWKPHRIVVGPAQPLRALRAYYRAAQQRFGVGWPVLAAVNHVESAFGRLRNSSVSGAQGPMQFMPSTWRAYGLGGNVRDPRDAIFGAANYLHANGAPGRYRAALLHYNPSPLYVDAVMRFARLIAADRDVLPQLYAWQVFVRDRRVTNP